MNTSLPARVKALRDRLAALDKLGANVEEASNLAGLRSDLDSPAADLSRVLDKHALLTDSEIDAEVPASLDTARRRAADLLEKFKAEKVAATLKKGVRWTNLVRDVVIASSDVANLVEQSWKAYRQEIFTGESPGILRGRIAFTPVNKTSFQHYQQKHHELLEEFKQLPADRAAIDRVRSLAEELTEIAKGFDYDVPADVKRFLEAVQSGGATLDLLTDTVKTWLTENNAFANYRILPRGADGGR